MRANRQKSSSGSFSRRKLFWNVNEAVRCCLRGATLGLGLVISDHPKGTAVIIVAGPNGYYGSVPRCSNSSAKRVSACFTEAFSNDQRLQRATVLAWSSLNSYACRNL